MRAVDAVMECLKAEGVEVVFGLPGVGLLTFHSFQSLDLPVIMATVIYGAFFITIMSALVDIVYARLDPRIRPS